MRKILLILSCALALPFFAQQDPQYSQYQFNQMVINPAYAGTKDVLSAVIDIRKQWSGFDGAPNTQSLSFHGPLKKKRIGLGLSAYNDAIGPKRVTAAYGNISYILPLTTKLKLSFGIRAGFINYVFDFNKMNYYLKEINSTLTFYLCGKCIKETKEINMSNVEDNTSYILNFSQFKKYGTKCCSCMMGVSHDIRRRIVLGENYDKYINSNC